MRLINKLLWYWLQQPDEMHLAATWYLIPVSTAPCYTHGAVKWQPHGSETSRHSHELPTQSWAVAWAKSWAMLVLSYPFEKGGQPSYHCFAPTGEIGMGLAPRLEPDWLCHGVPLGKFLNSSVPQFPHQEKKRVMTLHLLGLLGILHKMPHLKLTCTTCTTWHLLSSL